MGIHQSGLSREMLIAGLRDECSLEQAGMAVDLLDKGEGRLPQGTRQLPTEVVQAMQRARVIAAMVNAASEIGYCTVTVQDVIDRAGLSRPTFYEHFTDRHDCFVAAVETSAAVLRSRVDAAALQGEDIWRERMRLGLQELLRFVATEPDAACTLLVEAKSANSRAMELHDELFTYFAERLDLLRRRLLPTVPESSAAVQVATVGGVEALLYPRLLEHRVDGIESLLPTLMYLVVLLYEGHEAAGEAIAGAEFASA